jgi:hypothetical protein
MIFSTMKSTLNHLTLFALLITATICLGQNSTQTTSLFAQGLIELDEEQMISQELELRQHPNVKVVRLDRLTNRFFILIQNINSLTEEELITWFGENGSKLKCVQIGIHGIDQVNPFPFQNCSN